LQIIWFLICFFTGTQQRTPVVEQFKEAIDRNTFLLKVLDADALFGEK
jgi:hypothetical protein